MFQLLFRYPIPVFTKGHFVLLGAWPAWLLPTLIVVFSAALAVLTRLASAGGQPRAAKLARR